MVKLYLTTEISYQDLALKVGINEPSIISRWVNDFKIAEPDVFREKNKGRNSITKKRKLFKTIRR